MCLKKKLAIVSTHPVQYNAPFFKSLAQRKKIDVQVIYSWGPAAAEKVYDKGFGQTIQWDIPLLEGYKYIFPENIAKQKGPHHFTGIDNPEIVKIIYDYQPDAILIYGWAFKSHIKLLRHFHGKVPILFRGDSTLIDKKDKGYKALIRRFFLTWVYKHIDYALYTGKNNYDYFKHAGVKDDQLIYAPHAVDNERFSYNSADKARAVLLRQQMNIPATDLVFLFAGKLETKKDPMLLLQAFIEGSLYKKTHLVFVGNGELENDLKTMAAQVEAVHFMDFQNQTSMPGVYHMADVFVLPSKGPGETWGLAINESMAAGCAVIASDKTGGAVDLLENGHNGYIFRAGDKKDLLDKMELISSGGQLPEMKTASMKRIKQFSFAAVSAAVEGVMEKLV